MIRNLFSQKKEIIYLLEDETITEIPSKFSKIAIISYKDLTFIKREIPHISKKYISKVLEEDIEEHFPKEEYAIYWSILSEQKERMEIAVWIYKRAIEDLVRTLKCKYLIPEPLLYTSKEPTIFIIDRGQHILLIYSQAFKVYNYLTLTQLDSEKVILFIKSLKSLRPKFGIILSNREITIPEITQNLDIVWKKQSFPGTYPFLEFITKDVLKNFKIRKSLEPILNKIEFTLLLRSLLYITVAISLSLYLSSEAYEREISLLKKELEVIRNTSKGAEKSEIKTEIDLILQRGNEPLYVLRRLSELLPKGSTIRRLHISEDAIELTLQFPDPLVVLNNLSWEKCFKEIKLVNPIQSEQGHYSIDLKISTLRCRSLATK